MKHEKSPRSYLGPKTKKTKRDNMQIHIAPHPIYIQEIIMSKIITFRLPIKTCSEANCSEHWTKKSKRHKMQKWVVKKVFLDNKFEFNLPVEVTLVRVATKDLDAHDNLRISMKWIVDTIAAILTGDERHGRGDDSKEITWKYDQKRGKVRENCVEVTIEEK